MKKTLNRESLKQMLSETEYYAMINKALEQKLENGTIMFNLTPYEIAIQNPAAPENYKGMALSITAWCDRNLVYNAKGKLARTEYTVHSLIITRQIIENGRYKTVEMFKKVCLDNGSIRNDRKTESEVA